MTTIEIWPKEIEFGDAVGPDISIPYLKLADPEEGLEIIAMIRPDALAKAIAQLRGLLVSLEAKPH